MAKKDEDAVKACDKKATAAEKDTCKASALEKGVERMVKKNDYVKEMEDFKKKKADVKKKKDEAKKKHEEKKAKNEKNAKEVETKVGKETADRNKKGAEKANKRREEMGADPVEIDVATVEAAKKKTKGTKAAKGSDGKFKVTDANGKDLLEEIKKANLAAAAKDTKQRRMLSSTDPDTWCFTATYVNEAHPTTPTTAEMAVDAWYAQSIYFDYDTGLPTTGKE